MPFSKYNDPILNYKAKEDDRRHMGIKLNEDRCRRLKLSCDFSTFTV
jgi:hypothetical protein